MGSSTQCGYEMDTGEQGESVTYETVGAECSPPQRLWLQGYSGNHSLSGRQLRQREGKRLWLVGRPASLRQHKHKPRQTLTGHAARGTRPGHTGNGDSCVVVFLWFTFVCWSNTPARGSGWNPEMSLWGTGRDDSIISCDYLRRVRERGSLREESNTFNRAVTHMVRQNCRTCHVLSPF